MGMALAALVVDRGAESSFDAPKRFIAVVATAAAAALVLAFGDVARARATWRRMPAVARASAAAFAAGVAGIGLAAVLSPRSGAALATARGTIVLAMAAPLAALLFDGPAMRRAMGWFSIVAAANAFVSVLQRAGIWEPFVIERVSGRTEAVGLFGNEGLLALAAALGATAAAGLWIEERRARHATAFVLCVGGVVAAASLTPGLALGAGLVMLAAFHLPARRLAAGGALLAVAGLLAFSIVPQLRQRALEAQRLVAEGDYDALTSYRFGAWAAAGEMIALRPLTGYGPGTFAAEFVVHRIEAEQRWGRRLVNPVFAGGSYEEAHSDYLQVAAESGVPAALLLMAAGGLAVVVLLRRARSAGGRDRHEATVMLALVAVVAVAALAWFPMQRPSTALLALMVLGRAWGVAAGGDEEAA